MLILSRRIGEKIYIGDEIVIAFFKILRGEVKVGIEAPKDIAIHREEIYRKINAGKMKGNDFSIPFYNRPY